MFCYFPALVVRSFSSQPQGWNKRAHESWKETEWCDMKELECFLSCLGRGVVTTRVLQESGGQQRTKSLIKSHESITIRLNFLSRWGWRRVGSEMWVWFRTLINSIYAGLFALAPMNSTEQKNTRMSDKENPIHTENSSAPKQSEAVTTWYSENKSRSKSSFRATPQCAAYVGKTSSLSYKTFPSM